MTASHYDVKKHNSSDNLRRGFWTKLNLWHQRGMGATAVLGPWTCAPARWPSTPPTPACMYSITSCIDSTALQAFFRISYLRQHRQADALMYQLATTAVWTTKNNRACRTALHGHSWTSIQKRSLWVKEDRFMLQSQETCCKHRRKKKILD